jgi:hypothetical protein
MRDWFAEVIGEDLIAVYEGFYFTEDALLWLRERPRTFGELRAQHVDWPRWRPANVDEQELLEKLVRDRDTDVPMWVACNPRTPELVLGRLAEGCCCLCAEELRKRTARRCRCWRDCAMTLML